MVFRGDLAKNVIMRRLKVFCDESLRIGNEDMEVDLNAVRGLIEDGEFRMRKVAFGDVVGVESVGVMDLDKMIAFDVDEMR